MPHYPCHWHLTWPPLQVAGVVALCTLAWGVIMFVHVGLRGGRRMAWWRSSLLCALACCAGMLVPGMMHFFDTVQKLLPRRMPCLSLSEIILRLLMPAAACYACATLLRHVAGRRQIPRAAWLWPAGSAASGFAFTIVLITVLRFGQLPPTAFGDGSLRTVDLFAVPLGVCFWTVVAAVCLCVHLRAAYGIRNTARSCVAFTLCAALCALLAYVLAALSGAHHSTLSVGGMTSYAVLPLAFGALMYAAFTLLPRMLPARGHPCVCTVWASLGAGTSFCFFYLCWLELVNCTL